MRVGIPTEIKNNENRVAITEAGVFELTRRGHEVLVQSSTAWARPSPTKSTLAPARRSSTEPRACGPTPT